MTLDTTMNKQRTPFAQHRDVTMQVGAITHQFNRNRRRRKTRRSTTAKIDKASDRHDPDREPSHFTEQFQRSSAVGNLVHPWCPSPAQGRSWSRTSFGGDRKRSVQPKDFLFFPHRAILGKRTHGAAPGPRRGVVKLHSLLRLDRKSTRLNSSHVKISYAVFCLKKKKKNK